MENRMRLQIAQEEVIGELIEKLNQRGFVANAWFDPDGMLHVMVRSRSKVFGQLRSFWRYFFDNDVEDFE